MRILIIDDDPSIRYTLSEICHYAKWQPVACQNGQEGLVEFEREKADVVLVDYHMPVLDGLATVKKLRQINKLVPVLVLTVDERQEIADRFLDAGATDFALKPVKAPDLISRIQLHKRIVELTASTEWNQNATVTKGISQTTLKYIEDFLISKEEPVLIDDICQELGFAYPTVYRYLSHLMQNGKVRIVMSYQKLGRPKNKYQWIPVRS